MKVADLQALMRECNLQGHSRLQNPVLISLLQENEPVVESIAQEMDIFEQQEMAKSQPQVMNELKK